MSAGHCISKSFQYTYGTKTFTLPIVTNALYPTVASMFTIYAGVDDVSFLATNTLPRSPGVILSVSNVIVVSNLI